MLPRNCRLFSLVRFCLRYVPIILVRDEALRFEENIAVTVCWRLFTGAWTGLKDTTPTPEEFVGAVALQWGEYAGGLMSNVSSSNELMRVNQGKTICKGNLLLFVCSGLEKPHCHRNTDTKW
jgi:hypothetical protein